MELDEFNKLYEGMPFFQTYGIASFKRPKVLFREGMVFDSEGTDFIKELTDETISQATKETSGE